jgi:tetratricopeptide (TPR) repeat protein
MRWAYAKGNQPSALCAAVLLALTAALLIALPSSAPADTLQIGQRVAVLRDHAEIRIGDHVVDVVDRGDVLTVTNTRQDWILVSRGHAGWLDRAAVLPMEVALERLNQAVEQNKLDVGARRARAAIWTEQHFWDAAIAEASEALRQDPRTVSAYCVRSAAQRGKKAYDAAQADAQAAIALAPALPHGYIAAGDAWREQGFAIRAVSAYSAAIERDRGNAQLALKRGQARMQICKEGQWKLALDDFHEALALSEHDPACQRECQLARAQTNIQLKDCEQALLEFTDLLNRNSSDVDALMGRGTAYGRQRRYELALAALNDAVFLAPDSPRVYVARAEVRTRQYNLRGALEDLEKALSLDANCAAAYRVRGDALVKQRKWEAAFKAFDQALALEPNNAVIFLTRADAYDVKKESAAAEADRARAAAIDAPPAGDPREPASVAGKELPRR